MSRDEVQALVLGILPDLISGDEAVTITPTVPFTELDLGSLDIARWRIRWAELWAHGAADDDLRLPTVAGLAEHLGAAEAVDDDVVATAGGAPGLEQELIGCRRRQRLAGRVPFAAVGAGVRLLEDGASMDDMWALLRDGLMP